jgi:glycosyltransferase involved in cell wall biosynthesis
MQDARLTVICVSYRRPKQIPVLIHCFLCQTLQNFKLLVIHDGYDSETHSILSDFRSKYPDRFDFHFTPMRYNDFGHSLRDLGIKMCDTDYILITNDDNYYAPKFLEYMFQAIDEYKLDLVLCDMIHSHERPGGRPQSSYCTFVTSPARGQVDIGCFIVKSRFAKEVGFRDKAYDGDATYLEDIVVAGRGSIRIGKLEKVLFVHN